MVQMPRLLRRSDAVEPRARLLAEYGSAPNYGKLNLEKVPIT